MMPDKHTNHTTLDLNELDEDFNTIQTLLNQQDYINALTNFKNWTLCRLADIPSEKLLPCFAIADELVQHLSRDELNLRLPNQRQLQSPYDIIGNFLSRHRFELDPAIPVVFYEGATQAYTELKQIDKALSYAAGGLWLAEQRHLVLQQHYFERQLSKLACLALQTELTQAWQHSLNPVIAHARETKNTPPLLAYLKRINPIVQEWLLLLQTTKATAAAANESTRNLNNAYPTSLEKTALESIGALYHALAPLVHAFNMWLDNNLTQLTSTLDDTKQHTEEETKEERAKKEKQCKETQQGIKDILALAEEIITLFQQHGCWQQASDAYNLILAHFSPNTDHHQEYTAKHRANEKARIDNLIPKPSGEGLDWLSQRKRLAKIRQALQENMEDNFLTSQMEFNQGVKQLLSDWLQSNFKLLGEAPVVGNNDNTHPCGVALLGLGSLSQGGASAYSDVDMALLIESAVPHRGYQLYLRAFDVSSDIHFKSLLTTINASPKTVFLIRVPPVDIEIAYPKEAVTYEKLLEDFQVEKLLGSALLAYSPETGVWTAYQLQCDKDKRVCLKSESIQEDSAYFALLKKLPRNNLNAVDTTSFQPLFQQAPFKNAKNKRDYAYHLLFKHAHKDELVKYRLSIADEAHLTVAHLPFSAQAQCYQPKAPTTFQLDFMQCTQLPKLPKQSASSRQTLIWVEEKGWYFYGQNAHGKKLQGYIIDITQLQPLKRL